MTKVKILRGLIAFIFCSILIKILIDLYGLSSSLLYSNITPFFLASLAFIISCFLSKKDDSMPLNLKTIIPFNISLLIIMPFLLIDMAFGNSDIFAIASTMKSINTISLINIAINDFFDLILEGVMLWVIFSVSSIYLISKINNFKYILASITIFFLIFNPITITLGKLLFVSDAQHKVDLVKDFKGVTIDEAMGSKKNLVHIYLESIERSYAQITATKTSFDYFNRLEKKGLSFTNINQVYGTHFTAAGIVASQCGVPLLPNGIFDYKNKIHENSSRDFGDQSQFMGGVVCLGDILKREGYFLSYMNGSSLEIFSKGKLFLSHGYDRVFGINSLVDSANESRQNRWGLDDSYIFEKAENEIEELSKSGKPFALTMLTIGTHGPDAFLDDTCEDFVVEESYIPAAIKCTAKHVKSLLSKIESLGIMEDTIVVIQSDHLAMRNTLYDQLNALGSERRRNYFVILGADQKKEINTMSTPFDIYPTILEVMGLKPKTRTANLGISMLSNKNKLAEIYGIEMISSSLKNNVKFQELMWAND